MTTAEDEVRNATVEMLMNGSQVDRDKFIICTLMDIKTNGCAKACAENQQTVRPHITASAVAAALIAIVEYFKK
jgi:predicted regulator of amino acid metabolism with ACT domain